MSDNEHPDLLPPEPLGEVPRTDDDTEDRARSRYHVADIIETDFEDETTPSDYQVPTEQLPILDDVDVVSGRPIRDVGLP